MIDALDFLNLKTDTPPQASFMLCARMQTRQGSCLIMNTLIRTLLRTKDFFKYSRRGEQCGYPYKRFD